MVAKLYKMDFSPPARAAMIVCEHLNVPVQHVEVDMLNYEHLTPEFLKKNPLHLIPVFEDGDLIIHDSNAILMYVADVYGKQDSFYPRDPAKRALVNQMLFFNAATLFTRTRNISNYLIIDKTTNIPQKNFDAAEEVYGFIEEFLNRHKYIAGDDLTIADIAAFTSTTGLQLVKEFNAQKYPKTQAWLQELKKLPAVQKQNVKGHEDWAQAVNLPRNSATVTQNILRVGHAQ